MILIVEDPLVRDQILVGTSHCNGVSAESQRASSALENVRQGAAEAVLLEYDPSDPSAMERIRDFREANSQIELVVLADARSSKTLAKEKGSLGYDSILQTPITADSFFRLMGRMAPRLKRKKQRRVSL